MRAWTIGLRLVSGWLVLVMAAGTTTHPLIAATYYVDQVSGDDARGTTLTQDPSTPWMSLTRAMSDPALTRDDLVMVGPGRYDETIETYPIPLKNGVAIIGAGSEDTQIVGAEGLPLFINGMSLGQGTWLSDVSLSNAAPYTGHGLELALEDATLTLTIDNVVFEDTLYDGVLIAQPAGAGFLDITLSNNTFYTQDDGLEIDVSSASSFNGTIHLESNLFSTFGSGLELNSEYAAVWSLETTATDNEFNSAEAGIHSSIYAAATSASHALTLTNNSFTTGDDALFLSASRVSAELSLALEAGWNTFRTGEAGIRVRLEEQEGTAVTILTASNNRFEGGATGVSLSASGSGDLTADINLADNILESLDGNGLYAALQGWDSDTNLSAAVTGNTFTNISSSGIYAKLDGVSLEKNARLLETDTTADFQVTIENNRFSDINGTGAYLSSRGLFGADFTMSATLSGNTMRSLDGDGVQLLFSGWSNVNANLALEVTGNDIIESSRGISETIEAIGESTLETHRKFSNNTIANSGDTGIRVSMADFSGVGGDATLEIMENRITNANRSGIQYFGGDWSSGELSASTTLSGNTITACSSYGVSFVWVGFSSASLGDRLELIDNVIEFPGEGGIVMAAATFEKSSLDAHWTISNNTITGSGGAGLSFIGYGFTGASYEVALDLSENTIEYPAYNGISVNNLAHSGGAETWATTIQGNTITGPGDVGVHFSQSDVRGQDTRITTEVTGNTITDARDGILIDAFNFSEGELEHNITVAGNMISRPMGDGISVVGAGFQAGETDSMTLNWSLYNNTVTSPGSRGLSLDVSDLEYTVAASSTFDVVGNQLDGAQSEGARIEVDGWLQFAHEAPLDLDDARESTSNSAQTVLIGGNTITRSGETGLIVELSRQSDMVPNDVRIVDNVVADGAAGGMKITSGDYGGTHILFSSNTVSGNGGCGVDLLSSFGASQPAADVGGGTLSSPGLNTLTDNGEYDFCYDPDYDEAPDVHAYDNYWGSVEPDEIDGRIFDDEETASPGMVLFDEPLSYPPAAAVTATLSTALVTDNGLQGASPGDVVRYTVDVTGTGETGCAAATFRVTLPDSMTLLEDTVSTTKGSLGEHAGSAIEVWIQWVAAEETLRIEWDVLLDAESGCSEIPVQGVLECAQLGEVTTDDPNTSGAADATLLSISSTTWYRDADNDGYGDAATSLAVCTTEVPEGYVTDATDGVALDCDDTRDDTYPGADEICDGQDNDCDDEIDEGVGATWYVDDDGDGFGNPGSDITACERPSGYVANDRDCNDDDDDVSPDSDEICDGMDNDCDDDVDEGLEEVFFVDEDGDGYGSPSEALVACEADEGYVANASDCDDDDADVNPGATETCDDIDNNCDGAVDDSSACGTPQPTDAPQPTPQATPGDDDDDGEGGCNSSGGRNAPGPWMALVFAGLCLRRRRFGAKR